MDQQQEQHTQAQQSQNANEQLVNFVVQSGLKPTQQNMALAVGVLQELGAMQSDDAALQAALQKHKVNMGEVQQFYEEVAQFEQGFEKRAEAIEQQGQELQERAGKKGWLKMGLSAAGAVAGWMITSAVMKKNYPGADGKIDLKPLAKNGGRLAAGAGGGYLTGLVADKLLLSSVRQEHEALKEQGKALVNEYEQQSQIRGEAELTVKQRVIESLAKEMLLERVRQQGQLDRGNQHGPNESQNRAPRQNQNNHNPANNRAGHQPDHHSDNLQASYNADGAVVDQGGQPVASGQYQVNGQNIRVESHIQQGGAGPRPGYNNNHSQTHTVDNNGQLPHHGQTQHGAPQSHTQRFPQQQPNRTPQQPRSPLQHVKQPGANHLQDATDSRIAADGPIGLGGGGY